MKKSKFTETRIVSILKEADAGLKISEVCRKHGISQPTFYNWKSKYGGMSPAELKRVKDARGRALQAQAHVCRPRHGE